MHMYAHRFVTLSYFSQKSSKLPKNHSWPECSSIQYPPAGLHTPSLFVPLSPEHMSETNRKMFLARIIGHYCFFPIWSSAVGALAISCISSFFSWTTPAASTRRLTLAMWNKTSPCSKHPHWMSHHAWWKLFLLNAKSHALQKNMASLGSQESWCSQPQY